MIVRVLGEGQYEVGDELMDELDQLDERAMRALEQADQATLRGAVEAMGNLVRSRGERVADERLVASGIIVPDADATFEELQALRNEEGFIPDPPS